ncbi:MAG: hypothetical protein AMJ59_06890 [Gammaproteobacteria bacterium SG8_31]|jgi:hypothetical protein|nr:MAG: hypothetical protein AMJ59_06890 [Gammaproteobacteria bacterium SG8_31]
MQVRTLIILLAALAATGLAWAEGDAEGKGILDFSTPPNELYPARLVGLDGKNIDLGPTRTSYWVEPGDHEITVTALIDDSMQVGTIDVQRKTDPGTVTITVEGGKRYKIAAQVTDHKGNWEPVIWKEEDVK